MIRLPASFLLFLSLAVLPTPAGVGSDEAKAPRSTPTASPAKVAPQAIEVPVSEKVVVPQGPIDLLTDVRDVRACAPQKDGRVVAATSGGVVVVSADGKMHGPLTALRGLPETRAHALLLDGDRIWIGTEAGLARAHLRGDDLVVDHAVPSKPVRALARYEGQLVAATWGGGLALLDERKDVLTAVTGAETGFFASLTVHDGTLFVGGMAGLHRLDDGRLVKVPAAPPSIWALASHGGKLWVGSLSGLSWKDGPRFRVESAADTRALGATDEDLLVGTFGQGLRTARDLRASFGVDGQTIVQAIGTSTDTTCIGTMRGLFVRRGTAGSWEAIAAPDLPSNDISALARDGDRVWIGTFDQGLALIEGNRATRVRDERIDDKINALAVEPQDHGSRLWIATARGLCRLDGDASDPKVTLYRDVDGLPANDIHSVTALSTGGVLVGTARGAAVVQDGEVTALGDKRGIAVVAVWAVAEGPHGVLFLGTSRGLLMGTLESRGVVEHGAPRDEPEDPKRPAPWLHFSMASGDLLDDWVTALAVDHGTVYVGTYNAGVTAISLGSNHATQLGGGYVNFGGLLVRDRTLFAATMAGLFARRLGGGEAFRSLPKAAPGRDVTAVVPADRGLWVASRRGLSRFSP